MSEVSFWDEEYEFMDRKRLEEIQMERLKITLQRAYKTEFYKRKFAEYGIKPSDIVNLDDIKKLPFTEKNDLREAYPYGFLAVDLEDVVRLHASSGTTGKPTVIFYTKNDIETWANIVARCIIATGATSKDIFQNMMSYGLFTGGLGLHYGAEKVGMLVVPTATGDTKRQIQFMKDFNTTVLHITPSYALHLSDVLNEMGISPNSLNLKKAYLGAEPYSESTKNKIEKLYNIDVYNSYGLSEMNGPGVAFECIYKDGMHIWEDHYIVEIIDPKTGEDVKEGEYGELVLTIISREAMPIIRYRTKDITRILPDRCKCGRTHRRIDRIRGRTDDMLIISGVNVFPSQIEHVLMNIPEVATNYQIVVKKEGQLDKLHIRVELYSKYFKGTLKELELIKEKIKSELKSVIFITPIVELCEPGTIPPSKGKAKRVIDERDKL
jgi:phenylacetate-CoA ligase